MQTKAVAESPANNNKNYVKTAHRSVSTNWVISAIVGVVFTATLYGLLIYAGAREFGTLHRYFVGNLGFPFIQILITFLFFASAGALILKWRNVRFQEGGFGQATELLPNKSAHGETHTHVEVPHAVEFLQKSARSPYLLVARLGAGFRRLRNTGSSSGVDDVMRSIADVDREMSQTSYTFLRFSATIIPVLGFLGTVFGISLAIIEFTVALDGARSFNEIRPNLLFAVSNLGLAFNTTLLALFFSGLVLAGMTFVQKKEEELLSSIERFCIDHLVVQLRPPSMSESLERAIRESATRTTSAIETQTAHLKESSARVEGSLRTIAKDIKSETQSVGKSLGNDLNELRKEFVQLRVGLETIASTLKGQQSNDVSTLIEELRKVADNFSDLSDLVDTGRSLESTLSTVGAELPEFIQASRDIAGILDRLEPLIDQLGPRFQDLLLPLFKITILGHRLKSHEIADMDEADQILARLLREDSTDA